LASPLVPSVSKPRRKHCGGIRTHVGANLTNDIRTVDEPGARAPGPGRRRGPGPVSAANNWQPSRTAAPGTAFSERQRVRFQGGGAHNRSSAGAAHTTRPWPDRARAHTRHASGCDPDAQTAAGAGSQPGPQEDPRRARGEVQLAAEAAQSGDRGNHVRRFHRADTAKHRAHAEARSATSKRSARYRSFSPSAPRTSMRPRESTCLRERGRC